jgi:hypothetical protein
MTSKVKYSPNSALYSDTDKENDFIKWFADNPALYKPDAEGYYNKATRSALWTTKADELGLKGEYNFLGKIYKDLFNLSSFVLNLG